MPITPDHHLTLSEKKKQYLVKWKGYPDSDNQWLDAKDMENAQELIAEFHDSNRELRSHIRRALEHLHVFHPLSSTLPSTLTSTHMSDASHSTDHATAVEENTTPLPIPPRSVTPDATSSSVHTQEQDATIQERIAGFLRICEDGSTNVAGIRFPHPDKPTPSELNDSDQENIPPSTPPATRTSSPVWAEALGRTRASIPFTNDESINQALLSALTRVRNNINRGSTYQLQIEEIIRIGRALQYHVTPSNDEEAALLVAQLDNIRRLESGIESDSTPSPPPANITFPTPTVLRNSQVTASTAASRFGVSSSSPGSSSTAYSRRRSSRS